MGLFTALEDLPAILESMGVPVVVTDDWLQGQCDGSDHYLWTDPWSHAQGHELPPSGYMVHHTASVSATPPSAFSSKANAWAGLWRDGKLYTTGGGVPTIVVSSAGPARISSGYGYRPAAWDHTFMDHRAPARAEGSDGSTALNRYVFNVETVHPGDGGPLDPGVWETVVALGAALEGMFGWSERTLGHLSWSQRKIDPYWQVGQPHDGHDCIIDIQDAIAEGNAVFTHFKIGTENAEWEPYVWLLYQAQGGVVDPNSNSGQVTATLPWKTNVRLVQSEDFDLIGQITGMAPATLDRFKVDGCYRNGKELSALANRVYG